MTIVMRKWKSHAFFIFSKYFIKGVVAVVIIIIIIRFQKKKLVGWLGFRQIVIIAGLGALLLDS